ncbi:hypothetical protein DERP_015075, partial [Dermatophagoides pteronyssinus]
IRYLSRSYNQQFPVFPQDFSQIIQVESIIAPKINGYGMKANTANIVPIIPIAKLLSCGSTDRNVISVSPVLAVDAIVFDNAINVIYIGKRLQSVGQRPDVRKIPRFIESFLINFSIIPQLHDQNCGVGHCKNIPPKIANDDNNSTKTTKIAILRAFGRNLRMIIPPAIVPIAIVKTEAAPKSKKNVYTFKIYLNNRKIYL